MHYIIFLDIKIHISQLLYAYRYILTKMITTILYVGKVSTRFEYFASGFASLSELTLIHVELGVEFNSESNGDIFRPGSRSKNGTLLRNTDFFRFFRKVFGVRIRYIIWVESKSGWVEFRIKFCVEWYYFRPGSSSKTFDEGVVRVEIGGS